MFDGEQLVAEGRSVGQRNDLVVGVMLTQAYVEKCRLKRARERRRERLAHLVCLACSCANTAG